MKIYVIGSTSFVSKMLEARDKLRELGHDGWIHADYEKIVRGEKQNITLLKTSSEKASLKRENNYLKVHYKHILESDAVLVVNLEKNGVENYIGGNVLIEIGQAYVNDKIVFLLNDIPTDMPYTAEIESMDPACLNGDLKKIKKITKNVKQSRKIILASTSPGRRDLMVQTGLDFTVEPSNYEEDMSLKVSPQKLVRILSQGKARAVAKRHKNTIVIGADSVAAIGKEVLGKPKDKKDAIKMLKKLSGKNHIFTTGLTVIDTKSGKEANEVIQTDVYFRKLSPSEISAYIATGESIGHAGAYAIQGKGAMLVQKMNGEYTNLMGLPLGRLAIILSKFGVKSLSPEKKWKNLYKKCSPKVLSQ